MLRIIPLNTQQQNRTLTAFKGMAIPVPIKTISCAQDAIECWNLLKHPKFTDIFQETEAPLIQQINKNKEIREFNYAFLDKLTNNKEKAKFIEYFRNITGFPSLEKSSEKILAEFQRVIKSVSTVLISGYDRFCSVGLKTAFPGSDLDKGYAIIKGISGGYLEQKDFSAMIKGKIWNNIDNRILSVNHCAAFPNIMTDKELIHSLDKFDKYAKNFVNPQNINYFKYLRQQTPFPISSSKFNIWLKKFIPSKSEKVEAKNLAYIIETIRDGARLQLDLGFAFQLQERMNMSEFSWCSNITQGYIMAQKYAYQDAIKPKLLARLKLEKEFDSIGTEKQYEIIKDVIRSMSGDNKNPEFNNLFYSPPDKNRLLINDILCDEVDCHFNINNKGEKAYLTFKTPKSAERYYDFDVYERSLI